MQLLPIDTAPKDGTEIFIYNEKYPCMPKAKYFEIEDYEGDLFPAWSFDECIKIGTEEDGVLGWDTDIEAGLMPTHWLPVPSKEELG